jgi:hypothetical protein
MASSSEASRRLVMSSSLERSCRRGRFQVHRRWRSDPIRVKGTESIRGREVTFVTVFINREKWAGRPRRPSDRPIKSLGEFWVRIGGVQTNKLTTFVVSNRTIRVRLQNGVAISFADRVVDAFAAGKVSYSDETAKEESKGVDLSEPSGLGVIRKQYSISFTRGPTCIYWVDFTLEPDGVVGHKVRQYVA